ncbi:cyclic nucleotide-binding domain-containing protein [Marispirochaeta sp.]|jgi:CRP/FNR family transcriptional regulator, cyclic AMP receptor protein|uniref:cyclic nucleotide-binding domain-containing protein n=1 Tax=Marispirochaeta sp. TaxID=2038653 RepID=UPI0029C683FD|nr:cyclic nucleotide-binding domain-containing protein [Marispirochaeta sp.]
MSSDQDIRKRLEKISLFAGICEYPEYLEQLIRICRTRRYKQRETIIQEGELGSEMFIVLNGGVEILKRTRAGDNYTVVSLKAEDNVFFGELALIDDDKRSATVVAAMDSEFLVISKQDFLELGDKTPALGLPVTRAIAKIIASRLRKTTVDMLTIFDALVSEIKGD